MDYQITVRHGLRIQRYHSLTVEAQDAAAALRAAADQIPAEILHEVDLVELRKAPDFDKNINAQDEA